MTSSSAHRRPTAVGGVVGLLLGALVLGPALAPGYTLHYDLVMVPDLSLSARTLGIDGSVPRAVPNDLVVALASLLLPGWLVQKILLLGAFVLGGAGAGRLARTSVGAAAAAALWSWNPWVGERLGIGHWGYLVGFALLPWVLLAAGRVRAGAGGTAALVAALTASALAGSTPGVLTTLLAVVVVLAPGGPAPPHVRDLVLVLGVSLLANAAWWWPFLRASSRAADPAGASAFAAGADTPFGVIGSLLLGGGLWHDRTWFIERTSLPVALAALLVVLVLLALTVLRRHWWRDPIHRGAGLAGLLGLLIASLAALPGGDRLLEAILAGVPGGGLLRDGQKFVALWVLLLAVATASIVDRAKERGLPPVTGVIAIAWPVATLPSLAWGHAGAWGSVDWPEDMETVTAQLRATGEPVAVLPWSTYRRYAWNDDRVVLDPWNRLLPQRVLSDDRLPLRDASAVAGEDADAARVAEVIAAGDDPAPVLRELGVRHVIVQTDQPVSPEARPFLPGEPSMTVGELEVHDLGPVASSEARRDPWAALGLLATGAAGALSLGLLWRQRRMRHGARRGGLASK